MLLGRCDYARDCRDVGGDAVSEQEAIIYMYRRFELKMNGAGWTLFQQPDGKGIWRHRNGRTLDEHNERDWAILYAHMMSGSTPPPF